LTKSKREQKSVELAKQILENYQPETVEDMQNALKDIFGPMFESMLKGEMNHHLGYEMNDKEEKETENRRNGYGKKAIKTSSGELDIKVPRDRDGSFHPELIPKRKKDVSAIENKVISMYARGMSQRDISSTIEDIYGFSVSHEMFSDMTDQVLPELEESRIYSLYPWTA
jgi:transposase-like protein